MDKKKTKKQPSRTNGPHEVTILGHSVSIAEINDQKRLLINGRPAKFYKFDAGYVMHANIYADPQKKLIDAVKLYLKREAG